MTITDQIRYIYNTLQKQGKKPNPDHLMSMYSEEIYEMYEKLKKQELKKNNNNN